jgi:acetylornithine deacetylase/succinyl-diaminopimelate desuccinylase-like protein
MPSFERPIISLFAPLKITNQQLQSTHAIDENISVDALYDAVRFYRYFIENYKG